MDMISSQTAGHLAKGHGGSIGCHRIGLDRDGRTRVAPELEQVAQFIAVCSSSIRAETLGYAASFASPWRGKRRVFEWRKLLLTGPLQPSTNADKLSETGCRLRRVV